MMMVMMVICAAAASAESMLHARSVVRVSAYISRRVESARLTMTMMNDDDEILKILDFGEFFNDGTLLHIANFLVLKWREENWCT